MTYEDLDLPKIVTKIEKIKQEIKEQTETALSMEVNAETVKNIKKIRADLNKQFKIFEERRKKIKNQLLAPYEEFEKIYKDCISDALKNADFELKNKINHVEQELLNDKKEEIVRYFNDLKESKIGYDLQFLTFEMSKINITLSASVKSLKNDVLNFIEKIISDLKLLEIQEDKQEIFIEYKNTLDISSAITTVKNRKDEIEMRKKREEVLKANKELIEKAEKDVKEIANQNDMILPPKKEEKIVKVRFTVSGTILQVKQLKKYMEIEGIKYE